MGRCRQNCALILVLLLALTTSIEGVAAQDAGTYTRFRLPDGRRATLNNETLQCFTLNEYVQLLDMDLSLRTLTSQTELQASEITLLRHEGDSLRLSLSSLTEAVTQAQSSRDSMYELWVQENRRRHELEEAPSLAWIPWTLTGVFAVATVALGVALGIVAN